jgi:hypothetical protein
VGVWGWGLGPTPQSPNPQSPIPNPQIHPIMQYNKIYLKLLKYKIIKNKNKIKIKWEIVVK